MSLNRLKEGLAKAAKDVHAFNMTGKEIRAAMKHKPKAVHGPSIDISFYKEHYGDNWREAIKERGDKDETP